MLTEGIWLLQKAQIQISIYSLPFWKLNEIQCQISYHLGQLSMYL